MTGRLLYLDTARLGRMSPGAQRAHHDFVRLAGAEGGSAFFDRFVRSGVETCREEASRAYPELAGWQGVGALKTALRRLSGGGPELPVLLANRSAQLMKLAARLLCHPCANVLVTDLGWPPYHDLLATECRRAGRTMTSVAVREDVLQQDLGEDELVDRVCAAFVRHGCDGLFLTAVSNLGVRQPVERIVRAVEAAAEVRFVVVDGAQEFCHMTGPLRHEHYDLYLAGCHKWLGAYHPMGVGFYGRRMSRGLIEAVLHHLLAAGDLDDPLLRYALQLEKRAVQGAVETVSLAALFSCQGAISDLLSRADSPSDLLPGRLGNLEAAARLGQAAGWKPLQPQAGLRSGILLLEAERAAVRPWAAEELRSAFYGRGVALTAYERGVVRLSMPETSWQPHEAEQLQSTLAALA